jgi:hypothetical protein
MKHNAQQDLAKEEAKRRLECVHDALRHLLFLTHLFVGAAEPLDPRLLPVFYQRLF